MELASSDILATTSVLIALATVIALSIQIRHSTRISRRSSNLNFLSELESSQIESELDAGLIAVGIGSVAARRGLPLRSDEVATILDHPTATGAMNTMLNHLENIAIAYDYKLVDRRIWSRVHGGRVQWWADMLHPYITEARRVYSDTNMWAGVFERRSSTTGDVAPADQKAPTDHPSVPSSQADA